MDKIENRILVNVIRKRRLKKECPLFLFLKKKLFEP